LIRSDQIQNDAAYRAIKTPIDGELRPLCSKIVVQAVKRGRDEQGRLAEHLRLGRMEDNAYWAEVERHKGVVSTRIAEAQSAKRWRPRMWRSAANESAAAQRKRRTK
jgi:hypothetical protein